MHAGGGGGSSGGGGGGNGGGGSGSGGGGWVPPPPPPPPGPGRMFLEILNGQLSAYSFMKRWSFYFPKKRWGCGSLSSHDHSNLANTLAAFQMVTDTADYT